MRLLAKQSFKYIQHTLIPFLVEVEVLEGEVNFDDASGFHSRPQDVLLRRLIVLRPQSV